VTDPGLERDPAYGQPADSFPACHGERRLQDLLAPQWLGNAFAPQASLRSCVACAPASEVRSVEAHGDIAKEESGLYIILTNWSIPRAALSASPPDRPIASRARGMRT
jgi:hypothetical protein